MLQHHRAADLLLLLCSGWLLATVVNAQQVDDTTSSLLQPPTDVTTGGTKAIQPSTEAAAIQLPSPLITGDTLSVTSTPTKSASPFLEPAADTAAADTGNGLDATGITSEAESDPAAEVSASAAVTPSAITWNGDWARSCDFKGNDMGNVNNIRTEECGPKCVSTVGCSHFVWTQFNSGTCWLKKGTVTKANALQTTDSSMVCGVVPNWNGNDWAPACDFKGRDMGQVRVPANQCGPTCSRTSGCSHYTWTTFNGGTCFMKTGTVSKLDAFTTSDQIMVCGVAPALSGRSLLGVCYDAMHNAEYPMNGRPLGNLAAAIDADFKQMAGNGIKYVRTYYSSFYGIPVAPAAAKYGIKLHLGVFMTDESWYQGQVDSAAEAVRLYPNNVEAILVGNENLRPNGPYSADVIIARMNGIRAAVQAKTGRSVPVGTVQRINEWLNAADAGRLAQSADVIGANIYTFFGPFNPADPANTGSFTAQWSQMVSRYGSAKLRLTETGFPSAGGASPSGVPSSLANAKSYYNGVINWLSTGASNGRPIFYFAMYDRHPDDNSLGSTYEKAFGLFTWNRANKGIM